MTPAEPLASKIEGALLGPAVVPAEASSRLRTWEAAGVARALVHPYLLEELEAETRSGALLSGAVAYPEGGSTLSTKRMELLECLRLGARGALVALTPGFLLGRSGEALGKEVAALLATAPELEVRFLLPPCALPPEGLDRFARLLRERRPAGVVLPASALGDGGALEGVRRLRARIPRKVRLQVLCDPASRDEAEALLAAGADSLTVFRPEALVEPTP
ncbi:MAG: hypothetical protein ACOYXN_01320 [Acidobacteriota bacterium]